MEFTRLLEANEFKDLTPTDQKSYIGWKLSQSGTEDVVLGNSGDGNFATEVVAPSEDVEMPELISNVPADSEDQPVIPVPEKQVLAPPGGDLTDSDDHTDLPPSMKGELSDVKEVEGEEKVAAPVADPVTEEVVEGKPAEEAPKPFLEASPQTTYLTSEDAVQGIQEKDALIERNKNELDLRERENNLQKEEIESLRRRMAAEVGSPPPVIQDQTVQAVTEKAPDSPSSEDIYQLWEDHENDGPYKAIEKVVEHWAHDLKPVIELAKKLKSMDADVFIEQMIALQAPEMIQELWMDNAFTEVDDEFPTLQGQWHEKGTDLHKLYTDTYDSMNESRKVSIGESFDDIASRGPSAAKWVMHEVLNEIQRNGNGATAMTPPSSTTQNGADQHTNPGSPPAAASNGDSITLEEAKELIRKESSMIGDLAADAVRKQNEISGQTTLEVGSRSSTSLGQGTLSPAQMKQLARDNPSEYRKIASRDASRQNANLNLLPRNRD